MTLDEKKNRAYIVTIIGALFFGLWMKSFCAALFMLCPLLFFGGLVVAVQHYGSRGWSDKD